MISRNQIVTGFLGVLCFIISTQLTGQPLFDRGYHLQWSPDGQKIACADWVNGQAEMWIILLNDTSAFEVVLEEHGDYYISWMPNSEEVIFDAAEFNEPGNLWKTNIYEPAAERVANPLSIMPAVSPDGNYVAYCNGQDIIKKSLITGAETNLSSHTAFDFHPAWSPDGSKVLFSSERSGNRDIWYVSSNGGMATQVTFDPASDDRASWHPNSSDITFVTDRTGIESIFIVNIDDLTPEMFVEDASYPTWLYDGSKMAYANSDGIWIMDVEPLVISQSNVLEVNIYPNPADELITIDIGSLYEGNIKVALISSDGRTIVNKSITTSGVPDDKIEICIPSGITPGSYFMKIKTKKKTLLKKVIIQ